MASAARIALLGATGLTGQRLMAQALEQGHHVTAIVRSPSKVQLQHENLKVIQGDVFSTESLKDALVGHDAVMSCLGFTPQEVTAYGDSAKAIVDAMRQAGVSRFIAMTAWYTDVDSQAHAPRFVRWILLPMIRPILASMRVMEQFLCTECSDINYTVVRPPGLKNEPPTGDGGGGGDVRARAGLRLAGHQGLAGVPWGRGTIHAASPHLTHLGPQRGGHDGPVGSLALTGSGSV
ncbi:flavin reductase (NADPH)-like isoform X3 [Petromyzon marinus]|nr:flavin reductase (NADPH)-like isoform X1 [Petromyzon marinus]XP_032810997.1 flavin reductase (NADPH)-like isoform X1 [Petromyzon marinus]XP_032810998.1 flavin reductase (NADPH)-like isoform X1 [Petromyzon marinus]XP_032810999.1 flavin reductase (NADPH)-like isoform X1 [Petromyzon marinus]XP_032811000.1 flavin reductase (NADPH)-like isoform X1 [Petromyzon marinus]XP_032811002.1 flavin reductase (NADPH)-like isoform X1 [Petromyzon marinus]XP_032811003.1 flavin reductase (NADPH)-like isoform 